MIWAGGRGGGTSHPGLALGKFLTHRLAGENRRFFKQPGKSVCVSDLCDFLTGTCFVQSKSLTTPPVRVVICLSPCSLPLFSPLVIRASTPTPRGTGRAMAASPWTRAHSRTPACTDRGPAICKLTLAALAREDPQSAARASRRGGLSKIPNPPLHWAYSNTTIR